MGRRDRRSRTRVALMDGHPLTSHSIDVVASIIKDRGQSEAPPSRKWKLGRGCIRKSWCEMFHA